MANQDGRLEAFYIGLDGHIYHDWQTTAGGTTWNGAKVLAGSAVQLAIASDQDGRLELFYVGTDTKLYHNWQTTPGAATWHGEAALGGEAKQIVLARNPDGRLEILYIGTNQQLYHNWQVGPNSTWNGEVSLDGEALALAAGTNADGHLEIFYIGTNGQLYHNWQLVPGGLNPQRQQVWNGESLLTSVVAHQLAVARSSGGQLEVFFVGADRQINRLTQTAPSAGPWRSGSIMPGPASQIALGQGFGGALELIYVGADDGMLHHAWQTDPSVDQWSDAALLDAGLTDAITVAANHDGRLEVFYVGGAPVVGTVQPRYQLLSVLYAPPGTKGSKSASVVDYSHSTQVGTTTSIASSFKDSSEVSVSVGGPLSASGDYTYAKTPTGTSTVDIKKTQTADLKISGPDVDGIDHQHDLFNLLLNPQLTITVSPSGTILWRPGIAGVAPLTYPVYVAELKNPATMQAVTRAALDAAGLTPDDYATILARNPFANGGTTFDPDRFVPTGQALPYRPPLDGSSDGGALASITMQQVETNTGVHAVQDQWTVTITESIGLKDVFSVKYTGTFQWTNTTTTTSTSSTTDQITASMGGPSAAFTLPPGGFPDVLFYQDMLYGTIMFAFATVAPIATGAVVDSRGVPAAGKFVSLTTGGRPLTTYTDDRGEYRLYGAFSGTGTLTVDGQTFPMSSASAQKITVRLVAH